jgi:hypothetical protein
MQTQVVLAQGKHSIVIGMAVRFSSLPSSGCAVFLQMLYLGSSQADIAILPSGFLALYQYGQFVMRMFDSPLVANWWYYIEVMTTDSSSIAFWVNGVYLGQVEYHAMTDGNLILCSNSNEYQLLCDVNHIDFDDIYVRNFLGGDDSDNVLGNVRVDTLRPVNNASLIQWTPSSGTNYQCVDDPLFDNGLDYVQTSDLSAIDSYSFTQIEDLSTIFAVQENVFALGNSQQVPAGQDNTYKTALQISDALYYIPEAHIVNSLPGLYGNAHTTPNYIWDLNPATSLPWTTETLNATLFGIKPEYIYMIVPSWIRIGQYVVEVLSSAGFMPPPPVITQWPHDFLEVPNASIGEIAGVPISSIKDVAGVE